MNIFIVSGEGFLAGYSMDEEFKKKPLWVPHLRDAKMFTAKTAKDLIEKYKLNAFIWKPFEEEAVRDKWEVVRRHDFYDIGDETEHNVLEWRARKVKMENKTDAKFLASKNKSTDGYYDSFEEAVMVAQERNLIILEEIQNKLSLKPYRY